MDSQPLVFLDIETTGMSPPAARITEIGAVRVEAGKVVGTFHKLINPGQSVPPFITKLTGIDDAMLRDAPSFGLVADELLAFLDGAVFIAHNVDFDYGFIRSELAVAGHGFGMDRLCTAQLSRKLFPTQPRHNLDTIIRTHGISVQSRHRALDDAQALYEFYQVCLEKYSDELAQHSATLTRPHKQQILI